MRFYITIALILVLQLMFGYTSNAQGIPSGRVISASEVLDIARSFGGFLYILGGILAGIAIIVSGVVYLLAGDSSAKIQTAKSIFKAGIIGAFIIFGAGLIINTVAILVADPLGFLGGGSGGGGTFCTGGIRMGQSCSTNNDCPNDLPGTCNGTGQPLCSFSWCG